MKKSNMSNHKISWRSDEVNGVVTHISELHDVPGYRFVVDASSGCQTESITVELSNGSLNGEVVKAEHLKKDELYSISSDCSIDQLKTFQDPRSPNSNALRWKLKVENQFFEMEQEANSKKIQDFLLAEGNEKLKAVGHTIRQEQSQKKVVIDKQETKKLRADREPCVLKEIKELKTANSEKSKRSAEETYELDETGKTLKTDSQAYDHKESDKNLAEEAYKHKESEMKLREAIEAHDHEDKENMGFLLKAQKKLKAEIKARECEERGRNCVDIEKRLDKEDCVLEESKKKNKEAKGALEHEERERNIGEEVQKIEDNEKTLVEEAYIHEKNEKEALEREEREKETMNEAQGLRMSRNTTMDRKNGSWQVDSKLRQAENGPEKNEYENNRTSAHVLRKEENIENGSGVIRRSHNIRVDMSHNLEEIKKRTKASQEVRQRFQNGKESEAAQHGILPGGSEDTPKPALQVPMNQLVQEEKKHSSQKMDKEERIQREMEERARKLDEEREREREREKDKLFLLK
ncbi:hypothetical protein QJS10_CPB14g00028 [Acorus calamus]|uniref:Trichohyalin-like n=1 Tax=Acorus calamus TaxID=4465 RepID=A0AAV9DBH7_ACOCL|nr:hypothetical protein QJS10_CPB14g00028 [Acorus calamus]